MYNENLKLIRELLVKKHGFALSDVDLSGLEYVYSAFSQFGQKIQYSSTGAGFGGGRQPSYAELMTATDADSVSRSYLASEENFRFLKGLESKNLSCRSLATLPARRPIRAVGQYVKDKGGRRFGVLPVQCRDVPDAGRPDGGVLPQRLDACRSTNRARSSARCAADATARGSG